MKITVEIDDAAIEREVKVRVHELFSEDARYRNTSARELIRRSVDTAIVGSDMTQLIAAMLPDISRTVLTECIADALRRSARARLREMTKCGFNIELLTDDERKWAEEQIAKKARVEK
jgi:cation transport ATPase